MLPKHLPILRSVAVVVVRRRLVEPVQNLFVGSVDTIQLDTPAAYVGHAVSVFSG